MSNKGTRRYCFTLNNYTDNDWKELTGDIPWITFICIAKEIAPTTNTPHLQGYFEMKHQKTITAIKKQLDYCQNIHLEEAIASADKNIKYCSKTISLATGIPVANNDKWFTRGSPKQQGHRTDLELIAELAQDISIPMKEVANTYPSEFVKYHKGIERLRQLQYEPRTEKPTVIWRYGKSGVGKTFKATEDHPDYYIKDDTKWWDNYTQQEAIIIDDFDHKTWNYRDFLRLLDKHKYQGQTKGGQVWINSPYIYITCEFSPRQLYYGNELEQVMRRLSKLIHVKEIDNEYDETEAPEPLVGITTDDNSTHDDLDD